MKNRGKSCYNAEYYIHTIMKKIPLGNEILVENNITTNLNHIRDEISSSISIFYFVPTALLCGAKFFLPIYCPEWDKLSLITIFKNKSHNTIPTLTKLNL